MLSRLCRNLGLPMIDIVRRDEQATALRAEGSKHVLVSEADGFDDELRALCARLGVRFAFDAVSGEATGRLVRGLGDGGQVLVYGLLSGAPCQIDTHELVFRHSTVTGFTLYHWLKQTGPIRQIPDAAFRTAPPRRCAPDRSARALSARRIRARARVGARRSERGRFLLAGD